MAIDTRAGLACRPATCALILVDQVEEALAHIAKRIAQG